MAGEQKRARVPAERQDGAAQDGQGLRSSDFKARRVFAPLGIASPMVLFSMPQWLRTISAKIARDFFARLSPEARQILDELLEKYADHGGAQNLRLAVTELQTLLYAA
jgi:hypothetical protein